MSSADLTNYGLYGEKYSVSLTSGSPTTLPSGPITNKKPQSVVIVDVAFAPSESITSYSYTLSSGAVVITPTFSSSVTRQGTVVVLYKK